MSPSDHEVIVDWYAHNGEFWWNETCAMVLEVFGLPGQRFVYSPTEDFMTFCFKSKKEPAMADDVVKTSEQKKEDWMNSKWRPMIGWMYMAVCIVVFVIVAPLLFLILPKKSDGVWINCELSEISPDFTNEMREACRQLRATNNLQKPK